MRGTINDIIEDKVHSDSKESSTKKRLFFAGHQSILRTSITRLVVTNAVNKGS